ncbi:hypothetical protein GE21DRAFT_1100065 [Neurospora crassa]|nr:hypothetical protein GE21DRAFT_1100065 [Neurospora crassa]
MEHQSLVHGSSLFCSLLKDFVYLFCHLTSDILCLRRMLNPSTQQSQASYCRPALHQFVFFVFFFFFASRDLRCLARFDSFLESLLRHTLPSRSFVRLSVCPFVRSFARSFIICRYLWVGILIRNKKLPLPTHLLVEITSKHSARLSPRFPPTPSWPSSPS